MLQYSLNIHFSTISVVLLSFFSLNNPVFLLIFATFKINPKREEPEEDKAEPKDYHLTLDMVMNNSIDPMIGMDNVTPYNFLEKNNA